MGLAALALGWSWLAGVYLGSAAHPPLPLAVGAAILSVLLGLLYRRTPGALLLGCCAAALVAGLWRYQSAVDSPAGRALAAHHGQVVQIRGIVEEEPTPRGRWVDLTVAADELKVGETWQAVAGRVLVRTDGLAGWRYGDRLELEGRLEEPPEFDGFSYREHLARQGIYSLARYPRVRLLGRDQAPALALALSRARAAASEVLARAVPEPAGSLAQGILLGERAGMPPDLLVAFARTNTTHIIAISGMNVALVVSLLQPVARLLPGRWLGFAATCLGIGLYSALVGLQASVVRAAIMGCLAVWARCLGRPADALAGLSLAGVAMTAANPLWLWDLGFQLSYLATAGLVLLAPALEARLAWLPSWLRSSLALTLAAQVATLPVLTLTFGQVGLVTPLANLLAVPALAPAVVAGLVAIGPGLLWQPLATPGAWLTWLLLTYMIRVVEVTAALPFAALSVGRLAPAIGVACYLALAAVALAGPSSPFRGLPAAGSNAWGAIAGRVRARWLLLGLALTAVLVWTGALAGRVQAPLITFLDVGQGDAILVQTPGGRNVLVDGGPDPTAIVDALGRRLPFWRRHLDLVVLTHPHDDHLVGLTEVVARYEVTQVLEPGFPASSPAVARWEQVLREKRVPRTLARAGQQVDLGDGVRLEVLHPAERFLEGTPDDGNNNSVVLRLSRGEQTVLLLGDAVQDAQRSILARWHLGPATVLKVPHHGAADALDDEFLAATAPRLAVISVGLRNRFGHPAAPTLAQLRGAQLYRTDLNGSIEVELAPEGLRVRAQR